MLLTLTNTQSPATDLGFLLHKHPDRVQTFSLSFGEAHVFYPEASPDRCTACLLVAVDPVGLVRGKTQASRGLLDQYVNDRPYTASSFLSVAIGEVYSSALQGRCNARPDLVEQRLSLNVKLPAVSVRGETGLIHALFEPLGYEVEATRLPLDEHFPEWGDSPYVALTLAACTTVKNVLSHLYVLLPVLDDTKHYWVGQDELEKLLRHGASWLATHPEKELIARRYLRHQRSLALEALSRLDVPEEDDGIEPNGPVTEVGNMAVNDMAFITSEEAAVESPLSLNEARIRAVLEVLHAAEAESVVDLGCGEAKLLSRLLKDSRIGRLVGLDVSIRALEIAAKRLNLDRLPPRVRDRITLLHGGLTYRDARIEEFDAALAIEVIEHLDLGRLAAFEKVLFGCARPRIAIVTTPNVEYNIRYETLPAGRLRHHDHRFEWTRTEFKSWGRRVADHHGYQVRFQPIGEIDPELGAPTQMAVFEREAA